ncbi:G2/M phase-specific E3 ubiquitin-protein ligase-like isoform X2 [Mercenaria mercenaria]|uniref:G2/M phase-specific E3 ubiquitin-protein ligase-like isoform X2 n=1 Tax=Mercenaria mercenaria TaxID=6596 RepID=UPI00234E7141|nr:G2/M phase-specific E3 ubiquitin-protein ligase-like isoform X2 [Mercenaria mercenaria]
MGITNVYKVAREDKEILIEMIKKHHIYYRISGEISQFTSGMNDVNKAWDMITSHAELFKPIFCFKPKEISGEDMLRLFKFNYSEPGSNNRALEDLTVFGWESFLQSIEDGDSEVTFSEILVFVTGSDHIPPCGFSKLIDVDFYTIEGRLPSTSTCALQLWLPRVTDPGMITTTMVRVLTGYYGFLKV